MNSQVRAVLFVNGPSFDLVPSIPDPADFLVAVDGGLRHLLRIGLLPYLLIGDMDSVAPADLAICEEKHIEIMRFPPQKDQTDLELALDEVLRRGYRNILIAYGMGGRLDHSLINMALLSRPDLANTNVYFDNGRSMVRLMTGPFKRDFHVDEGDLVSLMPWSGDVHGITTTNLLYPLNNESLYSHRGQGLSNVASSADFSIEVEKGQLLVIRVRKAFVDSED